ncbi:MAG: restriction endonuclease [Chloroflexota bacterium]|nr:restriction endonuclease [Chloroflexota bacterium]
MSENSAIERMPSQIDLMKPTLRAIHELGGSASIHEITPRVIEDLGLTQPITERPHEGDNRTELEYRLAWSRTRLKDAGFIENSARGIWSLTAEGSRISKSEFQENSEISDDSHDRLTDEAFAALVPDMTSSDEPVEEDLGAEDYEWRQQLMATLLTIPPKAFERLCQRLLRESGFIKVQVTGGPSDGGIDGRGIIRLGGLIGFPVFFQCKRYSNNVGVSVIRDFRGAMQGRAEKGLIITTGNFTQEAQREATRDGAPPIDLIDGELLLDKLKELGLGVNTRVVEVVEVDHDWFTQFSL